MSEAEDCNTTRLANVIPVGIQSSRQSELLAVHRGAVRINQRRNAGSKQPNNLEDT